MNAPVESVPPNVHKFAKKLIVFEWFLSAVPYILAASLSDMPHLRCLAIATSFYHRLMGIGQGFPAFCPSAPIPPTTASFTIHFALSTFHSSAYFLLPILRLSSSVFLARGGKEEFFLICFAMLCFALCTSVYMMYTLRYRNAPKQHSPNSYMDGQIIYVDKRDEKRLNLPRLSLSNIGYFPQSLRWQSVGSWHTKCRQLQS